MFCFKIIFPNIEELTEGAKPVIESYKKYVLNYVQKAHQTSFEGNTLEVRCTKENKCVDIRKSVCDANLKHFRKTPKIPKIKFSKIYKQDVATSVKSNTTFEDDELSISSNTTTSDTAIETTSGKNASTTQESNTTPSTSKDILKTPPVKTKLSTEECVQTTKEQITKRKENSGEEGAPKKNKIEDDKPWTIYIAHRRDPEMLKFLKIATEIFPGIEIAEFNFKTLPDGRKQHKIIFFNKIAAYGFEISLQKCNYQQFGSISYKDFEIQNKAQVLLTELQKEIN